MAAVYFYGIGKTGIIAERYINTIYGGLHPVRAHKGTEIITAQKWKLGLLKFQQRVNFAHRPDTRKFPVWRIKMGKSDSINIPHWARIRKRILERDGYQCRICGNDGDGAQLNVHHKDWDRTHNQDKNLVTLCSRCHKAVHMEGYKPILFEDWPEPWGKDPTEW